MGGLRVMELWRAAGGPAFALYLVAVATSLFRVADQPAVDLELGATEASLVPTDLVFAALAAVAVAELVRGRITPGPTRRLLLAAAAFAAWIGLTALPNGGVAIVAAGRLLELGVLALATAVLVRRMEHLRLLVATLLVMTLAAVAVALVGFAAELGERQTSFMGAHDLAALASMMLAVGLAQVFASRRVDSVVGVTVAVGAVGVVLGAALASLLGVYLLSGALIAVAAVRGSLRMRAVVITALALAFTTAGTLSIRSGDLGFLRVLAQQEEEVPGEFASSWSQRLIYAYVGLRVFQDNPVAGTGWYPLLPPNEFAEYVPAARERFDNQPAHYFPPVDSTYTPQQTPDQVLYELGLIGLGLLVLLGVVVARTAWRTATAWPRAPDDAAAYLPAAWAASLLGVIAGAALYGGTAIAAIFWLTIGTVAAVPMLMPRTADVADELRPAGAAR